MKITKTRLKEIIQEVLEDVLEEATADELHMIIKSEL